MASVQPATALSQGNSKFIGEYPLHIISSDRRLAPYDNCGFMGKLSVTKERLLTRETMPRTPLTHWARDLGAALRSEGSVQLMESFGRQYGLAHEGWPSAW